MSVLGIATGVGLVVAVAAVLASVTATAESVAASGADYEVSRPGGFDAAAIDAISSLDGVDDVAAAVSLPVLLNGESGWLLAAESSAPLAGTEALVAAVDEPVGGTGLAGLDSVSLTGFDGRTTTVALSGDADPELRDQLGGRFVATELGDAIELAGVGGPTSVFVFGDVDRERLLSVAGVGASAQTPAEKISFAEGALAPLVSSLSLISLMGVLVGGALVFNTVNTNALENRNESALLRALGSNRRSVRIGALGEGLVIGLLGSVLGTLLGLAVGASTVATIPAAFSNLVGAPFRLAVPWWLLAVGLVTGVALSTVSSYGPARAVGRIEPIEGIRETDAIEFERAPLSWVRFGIGAVAVLGGAIVGGGIGLLAAASGGMLALRALAPVLAALVAGVASKFGGTGRLASLALTRSSRRVWSTTLVLVLSAAISLMTVGVLNDFARTSEEDLSTVARPSYWVSTVSGDDVPVIGLPEEWPADVAAIDGVIGVATTRFVTTSLDGRQIGVLGVGGESAYPYVALASEAARAAMESEEGIIVNRQFSNAFSLGVGDEITLPQTVPPRTVPIVAVTEGLAVAEGGLIVISAPTLNALYGVDSVATIEVTATPEASEPVRAALTSLASEADFPVRVIPGEQFLDEGLTSVRQIGTILGLILLVVAICSSIAVLNTFAASVLARRREFGVIRAIGSTRRQIVRSVIAEAAAIGLVAGVLGAAFGAFLQFIASQALDDLFHIDFRFPLAAAALAVLLTVGVSCGGCWLALRRSLTNEVVEALSFE